MSENNRRDFLAASAAVGGAMALGSLAGSASAQEGNMKNTGRLKALAPGAVDASGNYVLPPLPYAYDALSDVIDEQTMHIHHDKHHQGYVNGLITAEKELANARASGDYSLIQYWSRKASFNGGGHFLHTIFWDCMTPEMGQKPSGDLAKAIDRDFGGYEPMIAHFKAAAKAVEGSGWGIMAYSFGADKLVIIQGQNQQLLTQWAIVPLLTLDVWEHAYYLKYQNNRGAYVEGFEKIINWKAIGQRYEIARS